MAEEDLPDDADDAEEVSAEDGDDVEDFPDDADFDFDEDEDEEGAGSEKKRWMIIGSSAVVGLLVLAGGGYWLFSGEGGEEPKYNIPVVKLDLPPRRGGGLGAGRRSLNALARNPGAANKPTGGRRRAGGLNALVRDPSATKGRDPGKEGATPAPTGLPPAPSAGRAPGGALVLPSATADAFSRLPTLLKIAALAPAPDKGVSEPGAQGTLPKIGADGRKPWQVYARPFQGLPGQARIAIVITGLGLSQASTRAAIDKLPAGVTLAFNPYARDLERWLAEARKAGHETLLSLPLEPVDFPISDPGPDALRTDLSAKQNLEKLEYILGLATGYVGVAEMMGSRMAASELAFKPILEALSKRGVLYLGSRLLRQSRAESLSRRFGMPYAGIDLVIDRVVSKRAIDAQLDKLEKIARQRASAVATAEPYPLTLGRLAAWLSTLPNKKLGLAPVSALAK